MKQILIVDDHPLVRTGFAQLINDTNDLEVCGESADMAGALKLFDQTKPDLITIDLSLAGGSGLDLIEHIKARDTNTLILVASMHDEKLYAERVLNAGAQGYINKQQAPEEFISAIRHVLAGKIYLSPAQTAQMLTALVTGASKKKGIDSLSNRELEVFELIADGKSPREMADYLNLSIKTIETHQAHIKNKLNLKTGRELMHRAIRWQIENEHY